MMNENKGTDVKKCSINESAAEGVLKNQDFEMADRGMLQRPAQMPERAGEKGSAVQCGGMPKTERIQEDVTANSGQQAADDEKRTQDERKRYGFTVMAAQNVQNYIFKDISYLVKGLITPGLNILSAHRKTGKSWLALYLASVVAGEGDFWGRPTRHGRVLYMALEDRPERIKNRMNSILENEDAPERLDFTYRVEGKGKRLMCGIRNYIKDNPDTVLIVIDVLQKLRGDKTSNQTEYSHDYKDLGELKEVADTYGIAILAVTHNRKTVDKNNRLNNIAGGVGLTASADTILMLERKEGSREGVLLVEGRDVPEAGVAVRFNVNNHRWEFVKDIDRPDIEEAEYASSAAVRTVKLLLEENNGEWTGTSSELLEYGRKKLGETIAKSEAALGRKLNNLEENFEKHSIIHIKPNKNGGALGRKHTFKIAGRMGQSETEECRKEAGFDYIVPEKWKVIEEDEGFDNMEQEEQQEIREDEDIPFDFGDDSEELPFC